MVTQEWRDGLASTIMRRAVNDETPIRKWTVFDGPIDALWIENMNTVLDDNMTLCLANGERIKLKVRTAASSNRDQIRKKDHWSPSLVDTTCLNASRRAPTAASRETAAGRDEDALRGHGPGCSITGHCFENWSRVHDAFRFRVDALRHVLDPDLS